MDTLANLVGNIITGEPWGCAFQSNCQDSFFSVGPQGDIYPCGRFDGNRDFLIGNINIDSIDDLYRSPIRTVLLSRRSEDIEACSPCEYQKICNSGCIENAYMRREDIMDPDFYCAGYKMLFSHVKNAIMQDLKKAV